MNESVPGGMSTTALLEMARSGDAHAINHLMRRYHDFIEFLAFAENGDRCGDAAQELRLSVLRSIQSCKATNESMFKGWLRAIAQNRAIDAGRKKRTREQKQSSICRFFSSQHDSETPSRYCARIEQIEAVGRALGTLPTTTRQMFFLKYNQKLTLQTIADRLDLTVNNVRGRMRRGRELLKSKLREFAG